MGAANSFKDFFDHPFFKVERVEINIRPTFLPLFFKPSETVKNNEIEKPHIIERILENIEVVDGSYLRDCLTGMKFELDSKYDLDFYTKGKFKAATAQFARQIFDTYYDPVFDTLKPTELLQNGREVYHQFKGNSTKPGGQHLCTHPQWRTDYFLRLFETR